MPVGAALEEAHSFLCSVLFVGNVHIEFTSAPAVLDGDSNVVFAFVEEVLEGLVFSCVALDFVVTAVPVA